jgi:8-oxo-dGTP diphosphatase
MKAIKVVCGLVWQENKVLIAKRKPGKSLAGYWEFPGGKIEAGEDAESSLIRELEEEMGMQIKISGFLGNHEHQYENFKIELIAYQCEFKSASFHLTDHDAFEFVEPARLVNYQIAPADLFIVDHLNAKQ